MPDSVVNELELAPPEVVRQSARDFAAALSETPQFKAFEEAADRLNNDAAAQQAMEAYQAKQQSLHVIQMLNAVNAEEKAELQRLHQAFVTQPSVAAYFQAQADLMSVCRSAADLLSQVVGLNFAAACGSSCC